MVDKITRSLFSAGFFAVLFTPWYVAFMFPHPEDYPLSGWFLIALSPYLLQLTLALLPHPSLALLIGSSAIAVWSAPILCLLNLLLMTRYRSYLTKIYRTALGVALTTTTFTTSLSLQGGAVFYGFWVDLGLLWILALYEFRSVEQIAIRSKLDNLKSIYERLPLWIKGCLFGAGFYFVVGNISQGLLLLDYWCLEMFYHPLEYTRDSCAPLGVIALWRSISWGPTLIAYQYRLPLGSVSLLSELLFSGLGAIIFQFAGQKRGVVIFIILFVVTMAIVGRYLYLIMLGP